MAISDLEVFCTNKAQASYFPFRVQEQGFDERQEEIVKFLPVCRDSRNQIAIHNFLGRQTGVLQGFDPNASSGVLWILANIFFLFKLRYLQRIEPFYERRARRHSSSMVTTTQ